MTGPEAASIASRDEQIEAVTLALRGDWLAATVAVHMLSEDALSDLANDLDDLRRVIDGVPTQGDSDV